MSDSKKIRVAYVKFGGLAAGGTEKAMQIVAANLPKNKFEVDYYYCDAAPYLGSDWKHPDTDCNRVAYMKKHNINLIKFDVKYKDVRNPQHTWIDTNFWDVFNEKDYDIIQTGRAGHSEYPFTLINETPIVDGIHLPGQAENKDNVVTVVHTSEYQANTWIQAGGNASKVVIIPSIVELPEENSGNFCEQLGLKEKFVFGLHQRPDDGIFSELPLLAYSRLESEKTAFILLGGSRLYQEQAKRLQLKNFHYIPPNGDNIFVKKFLQTLNVFTHGRKDGETFGLAIAEAMGVGLPIVSHAAPAMGHVETIGDAGVVCNSLESYSEELIRLLSEESYRKKRSASARKRFAEMFMLKTNIEKWVKVYEDVICGEKLNLISDEEFWGDMWD